VAGADADIVIVGAGSAGCLLANRLSADPTLTVTLIEAGGAGGHLLSRIPAGYSRLMQHADLTWGYRTAPDPATGNRVILFPRGRGLGGSSAINGLMQVRGQAEDYDLWAQKGCRGWSYQEVVPYFQRTERYDGPGADATRGRGSGVAVTQVVERGPLLEAFIAAAKGLGLPFNPDYNGPVQDGVSWTQQTRAGRWRSGAKEAFLDPAIRRPNLTVVTDALVTGVTFAGRRASGVRLRRAGREETIAAARAVVLCAGAIGTPQILQLSGVGPAELLARHGITVVHDSPGVGRNLTDHYLVRMAWRVRGLPTANERSHGLALLGEIGRWLLRGEGILTCSAGMITAFIRSREGLASPDIQAVVAPGSWREGAFGYLEDEPGVSMGVWQHRPESRGEVEITSADPAAAPRIRPGYLSAEEDCRTLVWGMRFCRRWTSAPPLDRFVGPETLPGAEAESDEALLAAARARGSTVYHPCSTARMGPDGDAMAVLDPELRVRGLAGLYVADASAFPTMTSGNTNATVYMLAEKASDLIAGHLADRAAA
jgi:choline dehydrogenase